MSHSLVRVSESELPVAVDAMGGDHGVGPNIEGALAAIREEGAQVVLVGDEALLQRELQQRNASGLLHGPLRIRHAPEAIDMDEKPATAVRRKRASSMRVACELAKNGEACGALSAGNSGAMMAVGLLVFGRVPGVSRPCIAAAFPTRARAGFSVLVDAGANTECSPEHLFQFGVMGAAYLERAFGAAAPVLGVLANGTEDSKGTELTRAALTLFRRTDLQFIGHCEGNQVLFGAVDVVVTDGFSGNILLKTGEGVARFFVETLRTGFERGGPILKLAGLASRGMFRRMKAILDYREFGAAPLLGLGGTAFIAHGSSDAYAIRRAIGAVRRYARHDITGHIETEIQRWLPALAPATEGAAKG